MEEFQVKEDFILNGEKFKILSGAIHYFRIHEDGWYNSLYNLKALGFNTVETYVPWNLHEKNKGEFDFEGILDIEKFLKIAKDLGLYAIVRPSPFICAEWEFGGLPAWLLNENNIRIRSCCDKFLKLVENYYKVLLPKLAHLQLDRGGNILMFQVENEYGSYGEDKEYLIKLMQIMKNQGLTMPFFTSDGPWEATLESGSLINENILVTGNFGSKAGYNFKNMKKFFDKYNKKWPLMCMEFWDGWFNRYNEPIIKRDPDELAEALKEAIEMGSVNLYMFHGGTNFGFMNGCSARLKKDLHQVTSYDYDALLDEQGNPTKKYYSVQKMIKKNFPKLKQLEPIIKETFELENIKLAEKVSLFNTIDSLSKPIKTKYPQNMEKLGQGYGYVLYKTTINKMSEDKERLRVIDANDRIQLFINGVLEKTQYQEEIGEDIFVELNKSENTVSILAENMGRVNYGHKLLADTQKKGIRTGFAHDLHFVLDWDQYTLTFENIKMLDFSKDWTPDTPSFYKYNFEIDDVNDTYLDVSKFGKGVAFINGNNIGRFYEVGPYLSLYVPKGFLKKGNNEIIIFETEGKYPEEINLIRQHKIKNI